MMSGL